jgi:hypothetical protein
MREVLQHFAKPDDRSNFDLSVTVSISGPATTVTVRTSCQPIYHELFKVIDVFDMADVKFDAGKNARPPHHT